MVDKRDSPYGTCFLTGAMSLSKVHDNVASDYLLPLRCGATGTLSLIGSAPGRQRESLFYGKVLSPRKHDEGGARSTVHIRQATMRDIDDIMRIYDSARQTMRANGNYAQWVNGYPKREMIEDDIARRVSYVIDGDDGRPHVVFMFSVEDDPTYALIEDGAWMDDEPYGVVHRIGSDGTIPGALAKAIDFCSAIIGNLRIDTHADNAIMHHVLAKAGFERCGTIYCSDGSPRVAYQLSLGSS